MSTAVGVRQWLILVVGIAMVLTGIFGLVGGF